MANLDVFDRLFVHFIRYPSFRDALKRSDPVMWRRLKCACLHQLPKGGS